MQIFCWDRVYSEFDEVVPQPRKVHDHESIALTTGSEADMSCFSEQEKEIIDTVCAKMKPLSARDISSLSHNEPAWQEALKSGTVHLVGTNLDLIVSEVSTLLDAPATYERMSKAVNPYGDGKACSRIVRALKAAN